MRTNHDKIARLLLPVVAGAGCMVTMLVTVNAVTGFNQGSPRIGDIVSFNASSEQPTDGGRRLTAHRPDQFGCVLDLNTLRHSGGSVVVESEMIQARGSFRVHWAGERTTTDTGNCGTGADLILDSHDLDILASEAGGYGVGPVRSLVMLTENGT
jgi:hypothetical protein